MVHRTTLRLSRLTRNAWTTENPTRQSAPNMHGSMLDMINTTSDNLTHELKLGLYDMTKYIG